MKSNSHIKVNFSVEGFRFLSIVVPQVRTRYVCSDHNASTDYTYYIMMSDDSKCREGCQVPLTLHLLIKEEA